MSSFMFEVHLVRNSTGRWRRQWHPTPVLLPGKSHGRRSLVGCRPWGHEESDMTERLHFHFSLSGIGEGNGNPLQCSCLENPRDGGAWWAAVSGVAQSWTWLKRLSSSSTGRILTGFSLPLCEHSSLTWPVYHHPCYIRWWQKYLSVYKICVCVCIHIYIYTHTDINMYVGIIYIYTYINKYKINP